MSTDRNAIVNFHTGLTVFQIQQQTPGPERYN